MINSTTPHEYRKSQGPVLTWNATIVAGSTLTIGTSQTGDMAYTNNNAPTSGSNAFCPNEHESSGDIWCTATPGTYTYVLLVTGADGSGPRNLGQFSLTVQ